MTVHGFKIGDKVRSRQSPLWGPMTIVKFYCERPNGFNICCATSSDHQGAFKPSDLYFAEDEMTDEELAKKFREARKEYYMLGEKLNKKGYSIAATRSTLKLNFVDVYSEVTISKTETKEI